MNDSGGNMTIEGRKIGKGEPCFIIAEVGINHNCDINVAKKMIDAAVDAKCDAAKFQTYKVSHLYSKKSGKLDWEDGKKKYSYDIYEGNKKYELLPDWIPELMKYCKEKGIIFMSSVFDEPSCDELMKNNPNSFKISSSTLTNIPLLEYIASKKLPVLISTGGGTLSEVEDAVNVFRKHGCEYAVLHCHLKYPTPPEDVNMNVIKTFRYAFPDAVVGFSDHTEDPTAGPVACVALGGKIIEKHITLDKDMKGPDHFFALNPEELKQMVKAVRNAEKKIEAGEDIHVDPEVLGSSEVKMYESERYLRDFCYQTIISLRDIKKGERLTKENIRILRPGKIPRGLEPKYYTQLIKEGYKVAKDVPMGKAITWDDLIEK